MPEAQPEEPKIQPKLENVYLYAPGEYAIKFNNHSELDAYKKKEQKRYETEHPMASSGELPFSKAKVGTMMELREAYEMFYLTRRLNNKPRTGVELESKDTVRGGLEKAYVQSSELVEAK